MPRKTRHLHQPTTRWTDRERLTVVSQIAIWLEETGEENALKHRVEVSAHVLQDLGVRLRKLATSRPDELERERYEILNGNPARYQ